MVVLLAAIAGLPSGAAAQAPLEWIGAPSLDDMNEAYPARALEEGIGGRAVLECGFARGGALEECRVQSEEPAGYDFGTAALALAPKFRAAAKGSLPKRVTVPVRFTAPDQSVPWRAAAFSRGYGRYSRLWPAGPFWPEIAIRKRRGGAAIVDCKVEPDARLTDCRLVSETPSGFFFGAATLRMAQSGWMKAGAEPANASPPADGVWRFRVIFPQRGTNDAP